MIKAYGAVDSQPSSATTPAEDVYFDEDVAAESSALLGADRDSTVKTTVGPDGHATIVSCVSNLCNTIIGSGAYALPKQALASAGLLPGILTCIFSGSVAAFGLYLLSVCATYTGHRRASFFAVSRITWPAAAVYFDAAIAIKCFGVSTSRGISYHSLTSADTNPPEWLLSGQNWLAIFLIILVPLCFLRRLDSLRHTSYIAMFSVVYLVIIVITCYFKPLKGSPERGDVRWVHFTPNFVTTFPVQVFAFTCSQNLFPLYNEVKGNTQKRMNIIIGASIGTATLTYEIIRTNIIAMYPSTTLFIAIGQVAIVILVMFSYPLQVFPCRNCLDKIFEARKQLKPVGMDYDNGEDDEVDADHAPISEMSTTKHAILTSAIQYFVSDLQLVLSFVGSTGSTTISFILPGLFYWKLTRHDHDKILTNRLAMLLAIYGMIIFVFCLGFNIAKVVNPDIEGPGH
ncbi:transmembrane amino acid transporter protein-domain-containing protein [Flagelloscypha sp. PMI_526]|nr:transmembrane amino acid transporter protein-domain-containing protein [Flagelloscypha sp. PMI_526]